MQETQETQVQSLGMEDSLEEKVATQSCIIALKIPCFFPSVPGRLQLMGLQRVEHDQAHTHTCAVG